ncbi:GLUCOSE-6-PHOSPHATE 1-EPIMERASE [Salix purpurea]|uniref:GLUCOSE-6-PHOSPHATE 1-EPIMERASE n=1 Tax=Salix purpurea TaxID=77065 RepID=A0A9Q0QE19_SALPP|nr:GLUCOSE-6-PHOSPHATE 1-EPIMERASE [Salix purpurea]
MSEETKYVELCKGINGLDKIILREVRGCSAEVYLFGGHVTSWKNEHGEELLFVSNKIAANITRRLYLSLPRLSVEVFQSAFLNSAILVLLNNMDLQGPGFGLLIMIPHHLASQI